MRLDKLVAERFGLSRRAALDAVRNGRVDVDGSPCLEPGREVEDSRPLSFHPNRPGLQNRSRHLDILYEDESILIVDKPAGLLTQPTPDRERDTLLERTSRHLARKRRQGRPYVGIVHRLDRDTSGAILLVIAPRALRPFQAMFRAHAIERTYDAVVEGTFVTPSGTIDVPLVRDRGDGRRGGSRTGEEGLPAITHYQVLETFGTLASLVACRLETGRTHQVRIHLAELGHPVVGDSVYRPRGLPAFPIPFARQALHARSLEFTHPLSGLRIQVEAPPPADLRDLAARLRASLDPADSRRSGA